MSVTAKPIFLNDVNAQTAAANGPAHDGEGFDEVLVYAAVSGFSSGTITPVVDASPDGGTTWYRLHTGTAIGANGNTVQKFVGLPSLWRIGGIGTMSLTYSLHSQPIKVGRP